MRIRTIKPEFWRSDDITKLSREDRLLFIGLWSYVDDNGVGVDDYRQIAADLFALEDDQQEVREFVREGLATLSRALLVTRYEINGKHYIFITSWDQHQRVDRPNKARYPRPPADWKPPTSKNGSSPDHFANGSRETRDTFATVSPPGTGEQGNRGTGDNPSIPRSARATDADRFGEFYDAYPRHVARKAAAKAWTKAVREGAEPEQLIAAAKRYADSRQGQDPKFTKHPATWLNQGCWEDEPDPPPGPPQPSRRVATTDQRVIDALALAEQYRAAEERGDYGPLRSLPGGAA